MRSTSGSTRKCRAHLDLLAADYERRGLTPEQARYAARRAFGGVEPMKEIHRDRRAVGLVTDCVRDVRFGVRLLIKERWFTAAAVLALGLGIAANNAVFILTNGILLRDLPFADSERVVTVRTLVGEPRRANAGVSYLDVQDWAAAQQTFDELGALMDASMNVADDSSLPEQFTGTYVSANAFAIIGQQPVLGRGFAAADDRPGAQPVVVLGDTIWRTRYAGDHRVIGRTIRVNGVPATVIGVMGEGFAFPLRSRLWQPLVQLPIELRERRDARALQGVGRLAPDITPTRAAEDLRRSADALATAFPATNRYVVPRVMSFRDGAMGGRLRTTFPILMTLVGFVLLIACANVANLLLARAAYRAREMSVRVAVGASRWQIVRQLLVESVVLAGAAGVVGLALSTIAVNAFWDAFAPVGLPYWIRFETDWRVFTYLATVCLGTAIAFGLVPAIHASKTDVALRLAETGTGSSGAARQRRWTTRFVVAQLALTPILLTGAGLMLRSMAAQGALDPGVETAGLVRMRLSLSGPAYETSAQRSRFYRLLEERFEDAAGLRATLASHAPFEGSARRRLSIDGRLVSGNGDEEGLVRVVTVGQAYFDVLATRPVRGHRFSVASNDTGVASAIVNDAFVARYFGNGDSIGHRLGLAAFDGASEDVSIVGVAADIRQSSTESEASFEPIVYVTYVTNPLAQASVLVRSSLAPGAVAAQVREHVRAIDANLPIFDIMTLDESFAMSDERMGLRVFGTIFVLVGVVALLLATIGLYAVTAYATVQRTREIGIRVALGSSPSQISWLIAQRASRQLAIGLSIGMLGALGLSQLLRGVLVGIGPRDLWTLPAVVVVLIVVTGLATVLPARRAMRLNPVNALRNS